MLIYKNVKGTVKAYVKSFGTVVMPGMFANKVSEMRVGLA
jgi:hypothetical protein